MARNSIHTSVAATAVSDPTGSTVTLGDDDIIRVTVVGDMDQHTVRWLADEVEKRMREVRVHHKKVLILADLTRLGKSKTEARKQAKIFLQKIKYDRIALSGANKENSQAMQYLLGTIIRVLRIRSFKTEAQALRWLHRAQRPPAVKARRLLAAAAGVTLLALVWQQYIAPYLLRLPDDFSYEASVISYDDFYNEQTASFGGKTLSDTQFSYRVAGGGSSDRSDSNHNDNGGSGNNRQGNKDNKADKPANNSNKDDANGDVLNIKNVFDVRTSAGEKVFAVDRTYGIDQRTRMHVPGYGDRDRTGFLFAPRYLNKHKQDFIYWHVNYDEPALMKFQAEEDVLGLHTYRYEANYHADQTKNLTHLPGVGQTRGVNLDINLQLWVEPKTGYLVKYEDRTTAYYYDLATGQRLNPWNRFSNSYGFDSVVAHVRQAEREMRRQQFVQTTMPILLAASGLVLVVWWGGLVLQARHRRVTVLLTSPRSGLVLALLVLVVLLAVATAFWRQTLASSVRQTNLQFQGNASGLSDTIRDELNGYIKALEGMKGLFAASREVSRDEWKAYADSLQLPQNYAGMLGVGFAPVVSSEEKAAHIRSIRSQGFPDYTITPDGTHKGTRDLYSPVVYIEPFNERNRRALGYDMLSEPVRRTAMERARDTGEAALTGKLALVQETEADRQAGMILYAPVYRKGAPLTSPQQRGQALSGYVYIPIRIADFMTATIGKQTHGLNIEIFDSPTPDTLITANRIYVADSRFGIDNLEYKPAFVRTQVLYIAGRTITVRYASLPGYDAGTTLRSLPLFVLLNGIFLSVVLSLLVYLLSASRLRALRLANGMTVDLRNERNVAMTSQHKVEAILASIGDGVFVLDRSGTITMFNKAAEAISGFSANEVIGRPYKQVLRFTNEKDGTPVDQFIGTALAGSRNEMPRHTLLKCKDGTLLPVADSAAPILNFHSGIDGAVVIFRDVSQERQLEAMKDEFLSIASHELRTPMGAVRANVSMMLAGDYGPVNKGLIEPLTDVRSATVRLVQLVSDLLSVARIEAGRMKFTLEDAGIRSQLQQVVASLVPLGKEKGVEIVLADGSQGAQHITRDIKVQIDPDKLKQVITNLVGNALKFTDAGRITISVALRKEFAEVCVQDTGIGIAADEQSKLFGKFSQITSEQIGKPAGTGLGLYISRQIARKMGGELWLKESAPGKGSVFALTVPLAGSSGARRARMTIKREASSHPDQR